ncbi:MAG: DUF1570 domain-containing protein, partial [Haloechinothrix sp.]
MLRRAITTAAITITAAVTPETAVFADRPELLEVRVGETVFCGKAMVHDGDVCWLLQPDGRLQRIDIDQVSGFRTVSPHFRAAPPIELREQLRREFGADFDVAVSRHYVVCAPKGRAVDYSEALEETYHQVHRHFALSGIRIPPPEFPLVALVFSERERFAEQGRRDDVCMFPDLTGYYHRLSNRIVLLEGDGFESTMIHETVHQLAFNAGLHSRIGESPQWVVEGLATVLEAPQAAGRRGGDSGDVRVNRMRFGRFREFVRSRRQAGSLARFVSDDSMFGSSTLDAYCQAWALSFYLLRNHGPDYVKYLKRIAARDPMKPYPRDERLADFRD